MQLEGRQNRGPFTKAKLKKIFSSWHIYLLTLLYVCVLKFPVLASLANPSLRLFNNGGAGGQPVFQQYVTYEALRFNSLHLTHRQIS